MKRGLIFKDPTNDCESELIDANDHVVMSKEISELIAQKLGHNFEDQKIIASLIRHLVQDQMQQFLREYDNVVADDILRSMKSWKLSPHKFNSEVDYDNARHAKLASFIDELKEKLETYRKSRVDDLIEKINTLKNDRQFFKETGDVVVWRSEVVEIIKEHFGENEEKVDEDIETVG